MYNKLFERYLEPPPRLAAAAEALPHLGGLALAPYQGALPDEIELHATAPLDDAFGNEAASEMLRCALAMPELRERMARGRLEPIGVSRRGERAKEEPWIYLVVAYDYTANAALEISLDERGALLGIREQRYQPPPTDAEIQRAIGLARRDGRIASRLEGLVAMAIPFSGADNEFGDRRVLEIVFGCRSDRLPKYRAWVDLGAETVLHAGDTCACCEHAEGVMS